jgi:hypothetical protein
VIGVGNTLTVGAQNRETVRQEAPVFVVRQIAPLVLGSMLGLVFLPGATAASAACAGDCGGDGAVSIDELIKVVGIILGEQAGSACAAADANGDDAVAVSDAIAAVNAALGGCPPPASREPVSAALSAARALAHLPRLSGDVAVALDALSGPMQCEAGGSFDSTCEDSGAGTRLNHVAADGCRVNTNDGPVQLDGSVNIVAGGQCPEIVIPTDIRFAFAGSSVLQAEDGTALVDTRLDATVTLLRLLTGPAPCIIKGGEATIAGQIVYRTAADRSATMRFDQLRDLIEFGDFIGSCDPLLVRSTAQGPFTLSDSYGSRPFSFDAVVHDMVVAVDLSHRTLRIDGQIESSCFADTVHLLTLEPLDYIPEQPCFTSGVLAIGMPAGTAQVAMRADGGVEVDADSDGDIDETYASCLDLPRQPCR